MVSVAFLSVLVLGVVIGANGNIFKFGPCPTVKVIDDLDFDKFSGEWFVVQRYKPRASCSKISIEKDADGDYTANETSNPFGMNIGFHHQFMNPKKITFPRNDTKSIFKIGGVFDQLRTSGVIDTDYNTYAVIWSCDLVLFGSLQNIDVLSRSQELDQDSDVYQKAKDLLKKQDIDAEHLGRVQQTHCHESFWQHNWGRHDVNDTNNIVVG